MGNKKIRVMIVDDMEAHRRRLSRIIVKEDDIELVGEAKSGHEAVLIAEKCTPDIILMDIEMEDKFAGINASKQINKRFPQIKIIVLTVHDDDNIVFAAFQTGIVDYVIKSADSKEIIDAVRAAYNNLSPIRPIIAEKIRKEFKRTKIEEESVLYAIRLISNLTASEFEVLKLLCKGDTRKEIANKRFVELGTIKKQINSILKKCERKSTKELVTTMKELKILNILEKV